MFQIIQAHSEPLSRRTFLTFTSSGLAALGLPWAAPAQGDPLEVFTADLIEELTALGETLVPEDMTPGMTRPDMIAWLERLMARDADTPIWLLRSMATLREGVAAVTGAAGSFAALSPPERHGVLVHLLDEPGTARDSDWNRRVVRPMLAWFYNSPRGHTVVGYRDHTGASLAGDVTSYTGPGRMPGEETEA